MSFLGIHTRVSGEDFEVYRRDGAYYWQNCTTDDEGFVTEYLGAENGPFNTAQEAFDDA
jgi:hypothetical protein